MVETTNQPMLCFFPILNRLPKFPPLVWVGELKKQDQPKPADHCLIMKVHFLNVFKTSWLVTSSLNVPVM